MKKFKMLILGFVIGAMTFGTATVWAASTNKIDVTFLDLKYIFDGKEKRVEGDSKAFIYNGTTYVPLRFAGESLGKKVNYDGKNKTIYIGTQPSGHSTNLLNLDIYSSTSYSPLDKSGTYEGVDGVKYYNTVYFNKNNSGENVYILNNQYKKFTFSVIASSTSLGRIEYDQTAQIQIFGDDKLLLDTKSIPSHQISPSDYEIDVEGVIELKIKHEVLGRYTDDSILFIEPTLFN